MANTIYRPLDSKFLEIRLLILKDAPTFLLEHASTPEILKCEFQYTSLQLYTRHRMPASEEDSSQRASSAGWRLPKSWFRGQFHALSYVWGNSNLTHEIEINGKITKITRSLAEALQAIRDSTGFRVLWADALCINQSDNIEKAWQVQQMKMVYEQATEVIAWLGPEANHCDLAFQTLDEFYLRMKEVRITGDKQEDEENIFAAFCNLSYSEEVLTAVKDLLNRPYWSRLWILQELALAKRTTFLCGNSRLVDLELGLLAAYTYHLISCYKLYLGQEPDALRLVGFGGGALTMCEILSFYKDPAFLVVPRETTESKPRLLHKLLGSIFINKNTLQTSEMRDNIFALLGLATDTRKLGIVPNYTESEVTIFTDVAKKLISNGYAEILCFACGKKCVEGLPSWVPDWSKGENLETNALGECYNACGFSRQPICSNGDGSPIFGQLVMHGYLVGIISRVASTRREFGNSHPKSSPEDANDMFAEWIHSIENFWAEKDDFATTANHQASYDSRKAIDKETEATYARTLIADHHVVDYRFGPSSHEAYQRIKAKQQLEDGSEEKERQLTSYYLSLGLKLASDFVPLRLDKGSIGLGQGGQPGDLVVIFAGVTRPCIIRPLSATDSAIGENVLAGGSGNFGKEDIRYHLVGMVYIDGVMDGELVAQGPPLKAFKLI